MKVRKWLCMVRDMGCETSTLQGVEAFQSGNPPATRSTPSGGGRSEGSRGPRRQARLLSPYPSLRDGPPPLRGATPSGGGSKGKGRDLPRRPLGQVIQVVQVE